MNNIVNTNFCACNYLFSFYKCILKVTLIKRIQGSLERQDRYFKLFFSGFKEDKLPYVIQPAGQKGGIWTHKIITSNPWDSYFDILSPPLFYQKLLESCSSWPFSYVLWNCGRYVARFSLPQKSKTFFNSVLHITEILFT